MKRVIAVSDSHGNAEALRCAVELALRKGSIDVLVFLGDGLYDLKEINALLTERVPPVQLIAVRGNCDFIIRYPVEETFVLHGRRFLALHGHTCHVKSGLLTLSCAAAEKEASVTLFGHTHVPHLEPCGNGWLINPGALCGTPVRKTAYAEILVADNGALRPNLVDWAGEVL